MTNLTKKKNSETHRTKSFKCEICIKSFSNAFNLSLHQKWIHVIEAQIYKCDICDKDFNTKSFLKTHMNVLHGNQKNYRCDICEKQFNTILSLRYHSTVNALLLGWC